MAGYTLYSVNQPVPTFEDLLQLSQKCGFSFNKVADRPYMLMVQGTQAASFDRLVAALEGQGERPFLVAGPSTRPDISLMVAFSRSNELLSAAKASLSVPDEFKYPAVAQVTDAAELRSFQLK